MGCSLGRIVERFRENYRGFWRGLVWVVGIYFVALLCDGLSTIWFMVRIGAEGELHPVVKLVSQILGPVAGPLVAVLGKGAAGIIVAVWFRRWAAIILVAVAAISFWAAWYNVWGCELYVPRFMMWLLF